MSAHKTGNVKNGTVVASLRDMMPMRVFRSMLLTAVFTTSLASSCLPDKRRIDPSDPYAQCATVTCTAMFAMLNVQVNDANGKPVQLDNYYTLRVRTGEHIAGQAMPDTGSYTLIDDNYRTKLLNAKDEFHFVGFKGGVKVVDEPYVLSADCCHIQKVSGNTEIVIK